jgi:hypothetical protein
VVCPVDRRPDLVVIDRYKAKARTLRVLHEVDIDGNPLVAEEGAS